MKNTIGVPKPVRKKKISKVAEWAKVRKELKKDFEEAGITTCEIRLDMDCTPNDFLGFAHTKKRRYVTDLKRVVLSCGSCHYAVEYFSEVNTGKSMEDYLEGIIKNRRLKV